MLSHAGATVRDVLANRRRQSPARLGAAFMLMINNSFMIGWGLSVSIAALYCGLQAIEIYALPRLTVEDNRRSKILVLVMLVLSASVFGVQAPLVAARVGIWGHVCAVYLLVAAVVNSVFTTVSCRPAFLALVIPSFLCLAALPVLRLLTHTPGPGPMAAALAFGTLYFMFNVMQLWRTGTEGKMAELLAVRRYMAERDANEARLFQMTQMDSLTGLANRDALRARLGEAAASHQPAALLILDLDGFKYVNDTLGHGAGDEMLQVVARRLRSAAREEDLAARLGGDEFALLLENMAEPDMALAVADRLIGEISQPVMVEGQPINIGVSVGVAVYPLHGGEAGAIFANADLALYQAKAEGRHCARLYNTSLRAMAQGKVLRDTELRLAFERGEFEMFYQPQLRLHDGKLTGAEALLRWRHPVKGLLPPAEFLPALDGSAMGARVGAWVVETACAQAAIWRGGLAPDFRIAVNLFGMQFRSGNLVEGLMATLAQAGLPPQALEIEITENVILRHEDEMIGPLQELRRRGVGVAFDDYGTGFASLSMLTRYPVSRLKIDRSFTQAICDSPAEASIVRAIIRLAAELGLEVTAEGVETIGQLRELRAQGCREAQGYYFGKPMSADDFCARFGDQTHACGACPIQSSLLRKCQTNKAISAYS